MKAILVTSFVEFRIIYLNVEFANIATSEIMYIEYGGLDWKIDLTEVKKREKMY